MEEKNCKNFSGAKYRALQFAEYIGVTKEEFYQQIGLNGANFRGECAKSELSADKIANILRAYPGLSPDWLLLEKGEMLRKNNVKNVAIASAPQANAANGDMKTEAQAELVAIIAKQQETIDRLTITVDKLLQNK